MVSNIPLMENLAILFYSYKLRMQKIALPALAPNLSLTHRDKQKYRILNFRSLVHAAPGLRGWQIQKELIRHPTACWGVFFYYLLFFFSLFLYRKLDKRRKGMTVEPWPKISEDG